MQLKIAEVGNALILSKAETKLLHRFLEDNLETGLLNGKLDDSFKALKALEKYLNVIFGKILIFFKKKKFKNLNFSAILDLSVTPLKYSPYRTTLANECCKIIVSQLSNLSNVAKHWDYRSRTVRKLLRLIRDQYWHVNECLEVTTIQLLRKILSNTQFFECFHKRGILYYLLDIISISQNEILGGWLNTLIDILEKNYVSQLCYVFTWSDTQHETIFSLLIDKFHTCSFNTQICLLWQILRRHTKIFELIHRKYGFIRYHREYEMQGLQIDFYNCMLEQRKGGGQNMYKKNLSVKKVVKDMQYELRLKQERDDCRKLNEWYEMLRRCRTMENLKIMHDVVKSRVTIEKY